MDLKRELLAMIGAVILLNLLLAFGAIGLFGRMGPAIDRILQNNVYSIAAAEEILTEFAEAEEAHLSSSSRSQVWQSFQRASQNVTEDEERAELNLIKQRLPAALDGESEARAAVVTHLGELIAINRAAMRRVDAEARRLGTSGAWTAAIVGLFSFLMSLYVLMRLQTRFVRPLTELHEVLQDARHGRALRRCRSCEAPREVMQVTEAVNQLLDERVFKKA